MVSFIENFDKWQSYGVEMSFLNVHMFSIIDKKNNTKNAAKIDSVRKQAYKQPFFIDIQQN